jgi:hypothetical protein
VTLEILDSPHRLWEILTACLYAVVSSELIVEGQRYAPAALPTQGVALG